MKFEVGNKVRINWVDNDVLHDETGEVFRIDPDDYLTIKLDRITSKMKEFADAKSGFVCVDPNNVVKV